MRAELILWSNLTSKVNFTFTFNLNLKIDLKLNFKFIFQIQFHLKINLSFVLFQILISNLLRKRFCFISCFKNLIWSCGPSVPTPTLCTVSYRLLRVQLNIGSFLQSTVSTTLRPITWVRSLLLSFIKLLYILKGKV